MSKRIAVIVLCVALASFGLGVWVGTSRVETADVDDEEVASHDCPEIAPTTSTADRPVEQARTRAAVDPEQPVVESPVALLRRSLDGGVEGPTLTPEAQRLADEMVARSGLTPAERDALTALMPRLSPEERAELVERILGGAGDGGQVP